MQISAKQLAIHLLKSRSIKYGKFVLSSGKHSDYYIDLRLVPSHPDTFEIVMKAYSQVLERLKRTRFKIIAGIPTTGLIFASVLSYKYSFPMIYVRKDVKGYGMKKAIEGHYNNNDKILIVDDVSTSGSNILDAAQKLRLAGCVVEDAIVLIDRKENAEVNLMNNGIKLHYFTTIEELRPYITYSTVVKEKDES
ncbi:MAG: orotate phosphoribosyltransferase [Conexivisphaerales archaeon]